jgi:prepilin signal peptidase PulO-like enzyme (type II secretory pathway)
MPSPVYVTVLISLILGFVAGVIVNLIADYLPWRRHYGLTMTSPFASRDIVSVKPSLLPHLDNGHLAPPYLWSGLVSALLRKQIGKSQYRNRRIFTEIGLAVAFALIAWRFSDRASLPFLLFYAAAFLLIAIIDIEHRWVFLLTIIPTAVIALVQTTYFPPIYQDDSIKGGMYGLGILFALYILGIIFAQIVGVLTGKRIGRTVLGFGDVYIGGLGGLIIGFNALGFALFIMVMTGAAGALILMLRKWHAGRYRKYAAIPYGPYILLGMAIMLYAPDAVSSTIHFIWDLRVF